jgi:hypothetical protein
MVTAEPELESLPAVSAKLKEPDTKEQKFEDVVNEAELPRMDTDSEGSRGTRAFRSVSIRVDPW